MKENKDFENENANFFLEELSDIGSQNPTLIAFGNDTFNILNRKFANRFKILKVPHYAITQKKKNTENSTLNNKSDIKSRNSIAIFFA